MAGAALTFASYHRLIEAFDEAGGLSRSSAAAVASDSISFCTFPSAGADLSGSLTMVEAGVLRWPGSLISAVTAFLSEVLRAALLGAVVLGVLDKRGGSHLRFTSSCCTLAPALARWSMTAYCQLALTSPWRNSGQAASGQRFVLSERPKLMNTMRRHERGGGSAAEEAVSGGATGPEQWCGVASEWLKHLAPALWI